MEAKKAKFHGAFSELKLQLDALQAQKSDLLRQVSEVDFRIKRVQVDYGALVYQSAPISILPNEVLAMVFVQGHAMSKLSLKSEWRTDGMLFEVVVSQVASVWREVALSTAELWSVVNINQHNCPIAEEYLQRSKGFPLDLRILLPWQILQPLVTSILDLIIPRVHQWRRFFLKYQNYSDAIQTLVQSICGLSAPLLEHFSISSPPSSDRWTANENFSSQLFEGGTPKLSIVRLGGDALYRFRPSFRSITTLCLTDIPPSLTLKYPQFCKIVTTPSCLINLSITGVVLHPSLRDLQPIESDLSLPFLRKLSLAGENFAFFNLLMSLSAPDLRSISFTKVDGDEFERFILAASTSAKYHLVDSFHCFEDLAAFLLYKELFDGFPGVKHASFLYCTPALVAAFEGDTSSDHISLSAPAWPSLQSIGIPTHTPLEARRLDELVSMRSRQGLPIRYLRLSSLDYTGEDGQEARTKVDIELMWEYTIDLLYNGWCQIYQGDPF